MYEMNLKGFTRSIHHWPRWLRWALGLLLIIVGISGLILPVMPGWIFLIPGIILLLGDDTRAGRWLLLKLHRARRWIHRKREERRNKKN